MFHRRDLIFIFVILLPVCSQARADMKDVLGNSFELTWVEHRHIIDVNGHFNGDSPLRAHILLYLGKEAHFFTKAEFRNMWGRSRSNEVVSGPDNAEKWQWRVRGSQITGFGRTGTGARRVQIQLDADGNCSLSVGFAKKQGYAFSTSKSMMNGGPVYTFEAHVVDAKCTFRPGNVFASP